MKPGLLASLVLALVAVGPAAGQIPYKGTELLRFALDKHGFRPVTEQDWFGGQQPPSDLLIVVIGDTSSLVHVYFDPNNPKFRVPGLGLRESVTNGGALLIASDTLNFPQFGAGAPDWGREFGISITGNHLRAVGGKGYGPARDKPFVRPLARVQPDSPSPFDLFNGVTAVGRNGVATDRPSEMSVRGVRGFVIKELAAYGDGTERQDGRAMAQNGNHFAISLEPVDRLNRTRPGRMIVLANRNVFANGMMGFTPKADGSGEYETDNGNWEFANRTIDWLQGGFPEKRTQCLFIEDGKIVEKFAETVAQPPKPPPPNIDPEILANWALNRANDVIPWAEESNYFNRMLEGFFGFPTLVRLFLFVVTIVFAFFALRWLRRGLRKVEPSSTITRTVQSGLLPRGGVLRQRTAAQIEVANLYEAARRRVRSRFDVIGGRPGADGKPPPVLTANDLADGPLIYQTVRWLWAIGYGETAVTVSPGEWDRVNALLERMSARAASGDWSFGRDI